MSHSKPCIFNHKDEAGGPTYIEPGTLLEIITNSDGNLRAIVAADAGGKLHKCSLDDVSVFNTADSRKRHLEQQQKKFPTQVRGEG